MVADLCFKLDRAREFYGNPMTLTSGYRAPSHNASIGGVDGSAHTKGMAADVRAPKDPFAREKMAWAFGAAGFKRVEAATKHFHVDVDYTKPTPAFFSGVSK